MFRPGTIARLCVLTIAAFCAPAIGAILTVTNTYDSGAGSLRDAIGSAGAGDTVVFAAGVSGQVALLTPLSIGQSLSIEGPGAASLTLDGRNSVRVIDVTAGDVTLSGITIANGSTTGTGAGVQVANGASLTVADSTFTGNAAANGGAIANLVGSTVSIDRCTFRANTTTGVGGGAVIVQGTADIRDSTFAGNTAPINGGALNVQSSATLSLINSTLSGNISGSLGGAISNIGTSTIVNATFSANLGSSGSAIATANVNVTLNNSALVDNAASGSPGAISPSGVVAGSNDVFFNNTANGTADDQTGYGTSNVVAAAAEPLNPLGNYGGPTQTMLPVANGAAVCAGSIALLVPGLVTDQRGLPRTTQYGSMTCVDAGAVQAQNPVDVPLPLLSLRALAALSLVLSVGGLWHLRRRGR